VLVPTVAHPKSTAAAAAYVCMIAFFVFQTKQDKF
jgi:hypothetical protein